jgi:hypothetical protein
MPAHIPADLQQQIQSTLAGLATGPLAANARSFFSALGYKSDRSLPVNSLAELRTALDTGNYLTEENALLSRWRSIHLLFQLTQSEIDSASGGQLTLGFTAPYETKDIRSYIFFALDLEPGQGDEPPTRTEMSTITRALNRLVPMPVLVLFRHGEAISLAIINRRKNLRDGTRDVLTRVSLIRNINARQPHRAHLDLLSHFSLHRLRDENASLRTFNDLDSAWQKLLSVQELNRRFYRDLVDWFTWAIKEIKLARLPDHIIDDPQGKNRAHATQEFTVRLICRLLFAWFLKEMRLIPADLLELYNAADSRRILTRGAAEAAYLEGNHYYRGILQNIFFMALNKPMGERRKSAQQARNDREVTNPELQKLVYVGKQNLPDNFDYDLFDRIPYLNGGLFDALPEDNLEFTHEEGNLFTVPNKLFYARREDNYTITVGTARRPVQKPVEGINRLFDRYRFTVMENTPLEEDVALDPELLGLVFENLLAEIDPTDEAAAESARKASGSYYTPRRIVDYMVNEALYLHIKTRFEQAGANKDDLLLLGQLCYHAEGVDFTPIAARVVAELDTVHVLDPACGSGAFPMGMLHRMVELLRIVDCDNELWKQRLLARLPADMRADAARGMEGKNYNYLRKLGLIQKNLYGLDNQPLATLIAKLRFFLTLVIEQEVNPADRAHNYNLQALPNLETNLLCCNTLVDVEHGLLSGAILEDLRATREEYYQPHTSATRREELAQQIGRDLANLFPGFAEQTRGIRAETPQMRHAQDALWIAEWFKHATVAAPFFNVETFFPELLDGGAAQHPAPFHIVIGNPPYGGNDIPEQVRSTLGLASKDPYGAFIARFIGNPARPTPLADNGVLAFIVSDTFMTIKSHRPLRVQMLQNRIHKMLRVHPDTFHATVNCAVIICQRGTPTEDHTCQMADLTNVSIYDQYEYFVHLLTKAEGFAKRQNITNQTYALYHYRQSLIHTNSNLPFFVASSKLFSLMRDIGNEVRVDESGLPQVAYNVTLNGQILCVFKLGDQYTGSGRTRRWLNKGLFQVISGIKTGSNAKYLRILSDAAQKNFQVLDPALFLNDEDAIVLPAEQKLNGITGTRCFVRFEMGMPADTNNGLLPCYHQEPSQIAINWSQDAVAAMRAEGHSDLANAEYRFMPFDVQISFSFAGQYCPTFRKANAPVFLNAASRIFLRNTSNCNEWLGLLNSKLFRYISRELVNHTVNFGVDDIKEAPVLHCGEVLGKLVSQLISKQGRTFNYDYASNEQIEIDRIVYEAYGLNDADIREVEDWYMRRYQRLATAQRQNLAAKQGITEEQLTERTRLHLFCDESCHLPHDRAPFLLLGLTSCPADKVRAAHEQLAAIWERFNLPKHLEVKWTKVSPGRLDFYQAVLEWFFASENVTFRSLVLPDKQRLYAAIPAETRDYLYYRLYYKLLSNTIEQENRYRVFIDLKDTRGREKITHLTELLRADANDPYGKSVESLQHVHSHEIKLLQVCDLLMGAVGFARRPVAENESPAKRKLVKFIEDRLGYPLTSDSPPGEEKCSIITWHDPDALLL